MITYFLLTQPGDRDNNEDNIGMYQAGTDYCFVLADGLGGHGSGEVASEIAVKEMISAFAEKGSASEECLKTAFWNAENAIIRRQRGDRSCMDMKTTCVALLIGKETVQWGHVGDSRLYYFKNGKLLQRTLDHSVPQLLAAAGQIREKEIRHHPDRNRLLRVMGIEWEDARFELSDVGTREGRQAFLLCSDGFWELIDEKKMESTLKKATSPESWLESMEEIVRKNGRGKNMDNYSAIGIMIDREE